LPPANSLIVFEAAARRLNFTHAATELGVTQAAVSRQIKGLEDFIGQPLFTRTDRRLAMTERGEQLKAAVAIGLNHIAGAVDDIVRRRDPREVTVAASVAFSSYWLMSRVAQFRAQHSEIDLRLIASSGASTGSGSRGEFDLAIRYGRGEWPGMVAHHLFDNDVFPVCAPSYLKRRPLVASQRDLPVTALLDETLLHLGRFDRNWVSWPSWFQYFGVSAVPRRPGLTFDNYLVLLHAVVAGEGLALCGGRLAQDMLARGDVVRPVAQAMQSDRAFFLVHSEDVPLNRAGLMFRAWLLAEAGADQAPAEPPSAKRRREGARS
jgi:LysR family transcriptional regulator, glycine cleavage system transcriptional activator